MKEVGKMNRMCFCIVLTAMWGCLADPTWDTGHFVMTVTDNEGRPVTNAVVEVRTLEKYGLWVGGKTNDYNYTRANVNSNGTADVEFRFWNPEFSWRVTAPNYYCGKDFVNKEIFPRTSVPSSYLNINTNTTDGINKLNELRQLEADGRYTEYAEKFSPTNVVYESRTISRDVTLYPIVNPQPMYSYRGNVYHHYLPNGITTVTNNNIEIKQYPTVGFDMENGAFMPPFNRRGGAKGVKADFFLERYSVTTNGICTCYGWMYFPPGCGAYKRMEDASAPIIYAADSGETFVSRMPYVYHIVGSRIVHDKPLLEKNEYMVLRTRAVTNDLGEVVECNYSIFRGPMRVGRSLMFGASEFNPRTNDVNLESAPGNNLAHGPCALNW